MPCLSLSGECEFLSSIDITSNSIVHLVHERENEMEKRLKSVAKLKEKYVKRKWCWTCDSNRLYLRGGKSDGHIQLLFRKTCSFYPLWGNKGISYISERPTRRWDPVFQNDIQWLWCYTHHDLNTEGKLIHCQCEHRNAAHSKILKRAPERHLQERIETVKNGIDA